MLYQHTQQSQTAADRKSRVDATQNWRECKEIGVHWYVEVGYICITSFVRGHASQVHHIPLAKKEMGSIMSWTPFDEKEAAKTWGHIVHLGSLSSSSEYRWSEKIRRD